MSTTTPDDGAAHSYVAERAGKLHPAWKMQSTRYEPDQNKFVEKQGSWRIAAQSQTTHFLAMIETLKQEVPGDVGIKSFDVKKAGGWNEVLVEVEAARTAYVDRARGLKNILTRGGRSIGDSSVIVEALADVLPKGEYSSVICGSLILIFKAAHRMAVVRDRVMKIVGEAPLLLEQTEGFVQIYPHDPDVNKKAADLYISLLVLLEEVVQWFEHGILDRLKVVVQQSMYGKRIDDKQEGLQRSVRNLREQIDLCHMRSTADIAAAIEECAKQYGVLHEIHGLVSNVSGKTDAVLKYNDQLLEEMPKSREEMQKLREEVQKWRGETVAQNNLLQTLQDLEKERKQTAQFRQANMQLQREHYAMQTRLNEHLAKHAPISQQEILILLNSDAREAPAAVDHYIRLARAIDANPDLVSATFGSPKFNQWLGSSDSQLLFVSPDAPLSRTSPGSFITASLTQVLRQFDFATTLTYFCSQQLRKESEPAANILANLICQLLEAQIFDLSEWNGVQIRQEHEQSLVSRNLDYLLSLFKYLTLAIPRGTIFLLIDDFIYFERSARQEALFQLISKFSEVVQTCKEGGDVVFKILIMTPDRTGRTVHQVPASDMLWVSEAGPGNQGGVAPRQQSAHLARMWE